MTRKSALGRGLGALLENSGTDITSRSPIPSGAGVGFTGSIAIRQIEANPFQPRTQFDQEKLDELAASIRQLGIIQPLTLRKLGFDRYQLISGERRFRAAQLVGLEDVPAYIRVANDRSMLEMALVENIQRDDLDAIEVAISFQRLIDECKLTQEGLGDRVGKKRSTIANYLRLLKLPPQIQKAIRDRLISMGHARAIINIEDEAEQMELFKEMIKNSFSVRDTEEAARKNRNSGLRPAKKELPIELERIRDHVGEQLSTEVVIRANSRGKGSLAIAFDDEDDLKRVLSILDLWP